MFELLKNEKSSNGRNRIRYKINEKPSICCEKIFSLPNYTIKNVTVTIAGEEMKPFIIKHITSFQEYEKIETENEVCSCEFIGFYNGIETRICMDNDLSILNLVVEDTVSKRIIENLQK